MLGDRLPPGPGLRVQPRLWAVDFTLKVGNFAREWIPLRVEPGRGDELDELIRARAWFRRHLPGRLAGEDRPVGELPVLDVTDVTDVAARAGLISPYLDWLRDAWAAHEGGGFPEALRFADRRGRLDRAVMERLFHVPAGLLYDRPQFASFDVIDRSGKVNLRGREVGEPPPALLEEIRKEPGRFLAREDPPACRIGQEPVIYRQWVLSSPGGPDHPVPGGISGGSLGTRFLTTIVSQPVTTPPAPVPVPPGRLELIRRLCARMDPDRYMRLIGETDGEEPASPVFLGSAGERFANRSTRLTGSQLDAVARYLVGYYRAQGLAASTQDCPFEGRVFKNVWVDFPGEDSGLVLVADHYDTAVAGEAWTGDPATGRAATGADDNSSATAALMEMGRVLAKARDREGVRLPFRHGIRLLHLVGEEYPADCLGARAYLARALKEGQRIEGLVLMDMIGYAGPGGRLEDPIFQLNAGEAVPSRRMISLALTAFAALQGSGLARPEMTPRFRDRFDPRSYLYNTDGVIFSDAGVPVLFLNEHINQMENINRLEYHELADDRSSICRPYAMSLARLAMATALLLASGV